MHTFNLSCYLFKIIILEKREGIAIFRIPFYRSVNHFLKRDYSTVAHVYKFRI